MDELRLFRGLPYVINDYVEIHNPSLAEIVDFGEEEYWSIVVNICSTSFDHRLDLEEAGVDYLEVGDYEMFYNMCRGFDYDKTKILIPTIDFSKLIVCRNEDTGQIVLCNLDGKIVFSEPDYYKMVEFIRNCHGLERNYKIPGNNTAREIYMREAREDRMYAGRKKFKSVLAPMVSALCNIEGFKYNFDTVWDLNIYTFMDATKRIQKIKASNALLSGIYGGMVDTSKMSKAQLNKDLNWLGPLE